MSRMVNLDDLKKRDAEASGGDKKDKKPPNTLFTGGGV
jgi:hypothetical protein